MLARDKALNEATAYLERDRKAHLKAHGDWWLDSGKLETALEVSGVIPEGQPGMMPVGWDEMLELLRCILDPADVNTPAEALIELYEQKARALMVRMGR